MSADTMIRDTIRLPKCWQTLVECCFDELGEDVEVEDAEHKRTDPADPAPYYDDSRSIVHTLPDGRSLVVWLTSGQSNYFGAVEVIDPAEGDVIYESEPWESFHDLWRIDDTADGSVYEIEVGWE